jgi:hypothetical protein
VTQLEARIKQVEAVLQSHAAAKTSGTAAGTSAAAQIEALRDRNDKLKYQKLHLQRNLEVR